MMTNAHCRYALSVVGVNRLGMGMMGNIEGMMRGVSWLLL